MVIPQERATKTTTQNSKSRLPTNLTRLFALPLCKTASPSLRFNYTTQHNPGTRVISPRPRPYLLVARKDDFNGTMVAECEQVVEYVIRQEPNCLAPNGR